MGIDDLVNKGKDLFEQNKDKVEGFLKSDQVEGFTDKVLDGAADLAKKIAPESVDARIDEVRDTIDGAVGKD